MWGEIWQISNVAGAREYAATRSRGSRIDARHRPFPSVWYTCHAAAYIRVRNPGRVTTHQSSGGGLSFNSEAVGALRRLFLGPSESPRN